MTLATDAVFGSSAPHWPEPLRWILPRARLASAKVPPAPTPPTVASGKAADLAAAATSARSSTRSTQQVGSSLAAHGQ